MVLFFITAIAFGQEDNRKIRYQKETEVDFEALDVEGALVKPQGSLIVERDGANFNPLIELRMDWDSDMSRSVNLIK
jgi:hypothetical protein